MNHMIFKQMSFAGSDEYDTILKDSKKNVSITQFYYLSLNSLSKVIDENREDFNFQRKEFYKTLEEKNIEIKELRQKGENIVEALLHQTSKITDLESQNNSLKLQISTLQKELNLYKRTS